ncbi:MAG: LamB/YcsF family protein [Opitutales bacterium]
MGRILMNCDLGENEADEQTERLLGLVDAANVCCGVHAGSLAKTKATLQMTAGKNLLVGAHPGLAMDGGRGQDLPDPAQFRDIMAAQLTRCIALADEVEVRIDYVKLHGSLYHAVEQNETYADAYVELLSSLSFELGVFVFAGGLLEAKAEKCGLKMWREAFFDRAYLANGQLLHRSCAGAVLDVETAQARFQKWQRSGLIDTADGVAIQLEADTFCVHSDSADAETLLARLRDLISL